MMRSLARFSFVWLSTVVGGVHKEGVEGLCQALGQDNP